MFTQNAMQNKSLSVELQEALHKAMYYDIFLNSTECNSMSIFVI